MMVRRLFLATAAFLFSSSATFAVNDSHLNAFISELIDNPPAFAVATPSPGGSTGTSNPRQWGALAAALWRRRGIVQVSVGSAVRYATEDEARAAAIRSCRGKRRIKCKVATTWNRGCGYITTGRNRRGAGWVVGKSQSDANRKCRAKGYRCKTPIGGCVN